MRKLGRSKGEHVATQNQQTSGLVSLLETMRVQMEVKINCFTQTSCELLRLTFLLLDKYIPHP